VITLYLRVFVLFFAVPGVALGTATGLLLFLRTIATAILHTEKTFTINITFAIVVAFVSSFLLLALSLYVGIWCIEKILG